MFMQERLMKQILKATEQSNHLSLNEKLQK
uniref:Uncharacterized protein n=1 Tax=Rhizophora mucronata TaxID=61149 RepID=A0A2P2R360_RHIMU